MLETPTRAVERGAAHHCVFGGTLGEHLAISYADEPQIFDRMSDGWAGAAPT